MCIYMYVCVCVCVCGSIVLLCRTQVIAYVEKIIGNGMAYEANGSVYFDTVKFRYDTHTCTPVWLCSPHHIETVARARARVCVCVCVHGCTRTHTHTSLPPIMRTVMCV